LREGTTKRSGVKKGARQLSKFCGLKAGGKWKRFQLRKGAGIRKFGRKSKRTPGEKTRNRRFKGKEKKQAGPGQVRGGRRKKKWDSKTQKGSTPKIVSRKKGKP